MGTKPQPPALSLSEWLRAARAPYLNFLRNLTPQVFLASLAWIIAYRLDFSRFDASNWLSTAGFYIFLTLFGYAVYSNITLFFSELFPGLSPWLKEYESSLKTSGAPRRRVPILLLKATVKERKLEMALAFIAITMVQFVLSGVLVASIGTAVSFIHHARMMATQAER